MFIRCVLKLLLQTVDSFFQLRDVFLLLLAIADQRKHTSLDSFVVINKAQPFEV